MIQYSNGLLLIAAIFHVAVLIVFSDDDMLPKKLTLELDAKSSLERPYRHAMITITPTAMLRLLLSFREYALATLAIITGSPSVRLERSVAALL